MYLGIEIGGTKLQLGIGPGDGALKALCRRGVDAAGGADGIRRQITDALPQLLREARLRAGDLKGVGIGFGGPVDDVTRTVIKSHQLQGWDNFPLADWITDLVGLPAALGNDADVAGLAEALFGAGKGWSPIFYITIGSGIGGGLIINGEIYRGCGRGAAEIGHLSVCYRRYPALADLYEGTVEGAASGWAIANEARACIAGNVGRDSPLGQIDAASVTSKDVAAAATQGYGLAQDILNSAWTGLASGICAVIALLAPRRIIIGGGVALMGETLLFQPLRRLVAEHVFPPFRNCYDIVPAALGEAVVVHGALALAGKKLGGTRP